MMIQGCFPSFGLWPWVQINDGLIRPLWGTKALNTVYKVPRYRIDVPFMFPNQGFYKNFWLGQIRIITAYSMQNHRSNFHA